MCSTCLPPLLLDFRVNYLLIPLHKAINQLKHRLLVVYENTALKMGSRAFLCTSLITLNGALTYTPVASFKFIRQFLDKY